MVDSWLDIVADDGVITLREAIQAANSSAPPVGWFFNSEPEPNVITFAPALADTVSRWWRSDG